MKAVILVFIIAITIFSMSACKNMEEHSDMAQIEQMKDSVFKTYGTVGAISIKVNDGSDLVVVLGDAQLYKAPADKKQKTATEIGQMALRLFGKDNKLETGKIIISANPQNSAEEPADGISVAINMDSLRKATMGH